jgi:hypothetical protein
VTDVEGDVDEYAESSLRYMGPHHGPRFRDHTKATMKGMARIEITPDRVSPIDFQPATPPPIDIRQVAHNRLGGMM